MGQALIDKNGQTELYRACTSLVLSQAEVIELINSYPENERKRLLNLEVKKPSRFSGMTSSNLNFSGYNIGDTPLHAAAQFGRLDVVKKLLELGASVNAVNMEGNTPLHEATLSHNTKATQVLLEFGADANIANNAGDAPLHSAVQFEALETVQILLKFGADVSKTNRDFDTPLLLAQDIDEDSPGNKNTQEIIGALSKASLIKAKPKAKNLKSEKGQEDISKPQTNLSRVREFMRGFGRSDPKKLLKHKEELVEIEEFSKNRKAPPLPEFELLKEREVTPITMDGSFDSEKSSMEDSPLPIRGDSKFPPLPDFEIIKSVALKPCDAGEAVHPKDSPKERGASARNHRSQ